MVSSVSSSFEIFIVVKYCCDLLKLTAGVVDLVVVFIQVLCGKATFGKGASFRFYCADLKTNGLNRHSLRCRQCRVSHKLIFRSTGGEGIPSSNFCSNMTQTDL